MSTAAAPTPASLVADELLSYLQIRKGLGGLSYLKAPDAVPDGWETYTYHLQLHGRRPLPATLRRPLVLRVYAGPEGLPRLRRDWDLQHRLAKRRFPVARPVLAEEDPCFLGGPFLLMEYVEGEMLLDRLQRRWFALLWAPARMAAVHARLHQTTLEELGLRPPDRPFLERQLEALQAAVHDYDLRRPGGRRRLAPRPPPRGGGVSLSVTPRFPSEKSDSQARPLHRARLERIRRRGPPCGRGRGVADDRRGPGGGGALVQPADAAGRPGHHPLGLQGAYRRRLPLDRGRLRYYQAWAALRRLCWYGSWLRAGPHVMGYKPCAARRVRPGHVADLERYFRRRTGVAVRLGLCPASADLKALPV